MVYEVLYYNGWVEPGAYYLMGSAEGDSAEEAAQVSLTGITTQVRETFGLDPADVEDAQIQETLYLVPREGLIPLRTFARPS